MYSKKNFFKLMMVFLLVFNVGCSWWGGKSGHNPEIKLGEGQVLGASSGCVDEIGDFFSKYFKGSSSDLEVNQTISCVENVVSKIFENAEEQDSNRGFTRAELYIVLKSIFPKKTEKNLKDNIEILFLAKRLFVGGDTDGFSRSEHKKLNAALESFGKVLKSSRSAVKHIFYYKTDSLEKRSLSYKSLKFSFKALDDIRQKQGGKISEKEFFGLIDYVFDGRSISRFKEIALNSKDFLFGKDRVFARSEKEFFSRIYNALEVQSRFLSVDFSKGLFFGETTYDLIEGLNILTGSLYQWSEKDKDFKIEIKTISDTFLSLYDIGLLNDSIEDPNLVVSTIEKVSFTLFKTKDLDLKSFLGLNRMILDWSKRQTSIISKYNFNWIVKENTTSNLNMRAKSQDTLKAVEDFKQPQFIYSGQDMPMLLKRDLKGLTPKETYFDISFKHVLYTLGEEFFRAYAGEKILSLQRKFKFKELTLGLDSLKNLFDEVRPLGLEMGFINPHSCNSQNRVLIEADSLTMSGNGDNRLSIKEGVEWLGTMVSVGSLSSHIHSKIIDACFIPGMKVLGGYFLKRECSLEAILSRRRIYTDFFPEARSYIEMLSSQTRQKEFNDKLDAYADYFFDFKSVDSNGYLNLVMGSFNPCAKNKTFPISKRELNSVLAVSYYVENIFYQYDKTGLKKWHEFSGDGSKGSDYIIDGKEFSKFLKEKMSHQLDKLVPVYKSSSLFTRHFSDERIKKAILSLPESSVLMDRARSYSVLNLLTGMLKKEEHQYMKNYCNDVAKTSRTEVSFKKEERLMCTSEEKVRLNLSPE